MMQIDPHAEQIEAHTETLDSVRVSLEDAVTAAQVLTTIAADECPSSDYAVHRRIVSGQAIANLIAAMGATQPVLQAWHNRHDIALALRQISGGLDVDPE